MRFKELLFKKLTVSELFGIPSSFDIVGAIAIFNDFPLLSKKKQVMVADAVMQVHPGVETVVVKSGKIHGRLRVPTLKIIGGVKTKETLHKENGLVFGLDVEKCYFSPRSSQERLRITALVKKNESVLVMFSGVGPFTCSIAKHSKAKQVVGVELNKVAHQYALENIKLNKLENIVAIQGDVRRVLPRLKPKFDRIIMPLPKTAEQYVPLALHYLKPKGVMHLYTFAKEEEFPLLVKKYKKMFRKVSLVKAGVFGPYIFRVCLDLYS
ncbi:MAG: class I SAM-dependent methyltransferase family protein [Nanoarchaeota archaeon]|nr:class I SAM-dependent methyltransferase family protein [Nanoarchaeota archaeon]